LSLQLSTSTAFLEGADDWTDDSDVESVTVGGSEELTDAQIVRKDREEGGVEFDSVIRHWKQYRPNWQLLYPKELGEKERLVIIDDLMELDLKPMMDQLEQDNLGNKFGCVPLMMGCSIGQLGALPAESWAERVNSVGKLVIDVRKTRLRADMIDKLITLRMNTAFMEFMRLHYSKREKQVVVGLAESNVEASNEE